MQRGARAARWMLRALTMWLLLGWGSAALAQGTSSDELARKHFESGVAYLQESDYDNALRAFQKAFELSQRPAILLNIATVHERRSELTEAIAALERYLELAPAGEHVETVQNRVDNLKKRQDSLEPAAPAPESGAAPAPESSLPEPPPPAAPPATAPAREERVSSGSSRLPAYLFLGVGGVSAVGAVITGIMANGEHSGASAEGGCAPTCTDDELSAGRTLAVTSTVLTGLSIASAAVGVVLLLTGGSSSGAEQVGSPDPWPRVEASILQQGVGQPSGASARASWRF